MGYKEKLKEGVARTLARGGDLMNVVIPAVVGGASVAFGGGVLGFISGAAASYFGLKATDKTLKNKNKELEKKLDQIPMKEITKDFESALTRYTRIKKGEEPTIGTQEQLNKLVEKLKVAGYTIDGECRLMKFVSQGGTGRIMGYNFISPGKLSGVLETVLHESYHHGRRLKVLAKDETEVQAKTLEAMRKLTKDSPAEAYVVSQELNQISETIVRKAAKIGINPQDISDYFRRRTEGTGYDLTKDITGQLESTSRIKRYMSKKKMEGFAPYYSDVYIANKKLDKKA